MSLVLKDDRRTIRAWTFYDWANSVFPLVITSAIFPNFYDYVTTHQNGKFTGHAVEFLGRSFENQNLYSFVYAFALSIVVVIVPILSGIADYLGNKKRFLQFFCYLGSLSCMLLYFFSGKNLGLSFIPFITATIGFWGSLVYYNSYLPQIASPENQDRVSARGFALGYIGSSLLLIICLVGILVFKYNAETGEGFFRVEYSFLLTGIWWLGFAQYTFSKLPSLVAEKGAETRKHLFARGFHELRGVARQVKELSGMKKFLGAYFFYNMGVQTLLIVAVLFARNEISWPDEDKKTSSLIISILIIQFVGVLGSFVFSRLSASIGNVKALMIAVFIWIFICVFAYWKAHTPTHFYIMAFLVGFVMGGTQALSRSTYSKLIPGTEDLASFFSFYDVIEKLGMIIGTVTFGVISEIVGGMRESVLSLIVFFLLGFVLLVTLQKTNAVATDRA